MDSTDPFAQMRNCFTKAEAVTSESNASVNYMLARALSMSKEGLYAADLMNKAAMDCPKWAVRMLGHVSVLRGRAPFNQYIKKPKVDLTEKEKLIVKQLEKFYNIKPIHAIQVYQILKADKVDFDAIFGQSLKAAKK